MYKKLLLGVICAGFLMGPLCAAEEENEKGSKVERVGSLDDMLADREKRAAEANKDESTSEESASENKESVSEKEGSDEERVTNDIKFIRRHPGAEHHALQVTYYGDFVEMEDGSIWAVKEIDRAKVLDWRPSDVIAIAPNVYWFSDCPFCMINTATDAVVEVKLYANPLTNSPYTLNIVDIDYRSCRVYLSDNTYWMLPVMNRAKLNDWLIGDCVIVGTNIGFFADGYYPDLLLNVSKSAIPSIPGRYYQ